MTDVDPTSNTQMKAVRFHEFGGLNVLRLDRVPLPEPGAGQIRVAVRAAALNLVDAAVRGGRYDSTLPQGIGFDVAGEVDAVGEGVAGVALGDRVFGPTTVATGGFGRPTLGAPTGGAAEFSLMSIWARVPEGLDLAHAAALPLVVETAWRGLDVIDARPGETVLVNGAGTVVGEAAVQIALRRGNRVIATAGPARAGALQARGALVTSYGDGLVDRVRRLTDGRVDCAVDLSPGGSLPALIELTGNPARVVALRDFASAAELGVPDGRDAPRRYDVLQEVAEWAAAGEFELPIGGIFPLEEFAEATALAESGRPGGKILLAPRSTAAQRADAA